MYKHSIEEILHTKRIYCTQIVPLDLALASHVDMVQETRERVEQSVAQALYTHLKSRPGFVSILQEERQDGNLLFITQTALYTPAPDEAERN